MGPKLPRTRPSWPAPAWAGGFDSVRTGEAHTIGTAGLASTDAWFTTARNVALYANDGGTYDELPAYLKRKRMA